MQADLKTREYDKFREADLGLTKVAVTIEQDASNPVPVYPIYGIPKNLYGDSATVPDTEVSVLTYTVIETKLRILSVNLSCSIEGKATVTVNGDKVATSRTGAGKPDSTIQFLPYYELLLDDVLEVTFTARPQSKITDVETYINACQC